MKVLLATNNKGKIQELGSLITSDIWEITTPAGEGLDLEVEETGHTFEENAILKAKAFSQASGLIAIADDSGLEVDALNGEPGVLSARYAGPEASDGERVAFLLSKLADVPWEQRGARFRCVIAIAFPDSRLQLCEGECPGTIALKPQGEGGFGYDPIFYVPEFSRTMAKLTADEKNAVSHRGKAARAARDLLYSMLTG